MLVSSFALSFSLFCLTVYQVKYRWICPKGRCVANLLTLPPESDVLTCSGPTNWLILDDAQDIRSARLIMNGLEG